MTLQPVLLASAQPPAPPAPPGNLPVVLEQPSVVVEQIGLEALGNNQYSPVQAQRSYEAARAARSELRDQLDRLEDQRGDLIRDVNRYQDSDGNGDAPQVMEGLNARIEALDARITELDAQIAQADQVVAQAAAVPGAVVQPAPRPQSNDIPEEVVGIVAIISIFVLFPLTIAYARRLWKRGATVVAPVPKEVEATLSHLGNAVDSIALEVERIGEGQRFITKVMAEDARALGAGPVPHIAVDAQKERAPVERGDQADWR